MTRTDGWLRRRRENGPVATEPCCRSEWVLHGRDPARIQPDTRTRRKCCPRRRAPLGSSECIDRSKRLSETEEVRRRDGLTNKSSYKAVHGQVYPEFCYCHAGWSGSGEEYFRFTRSTRRARSWWRASSRATSSSRFSPPCRHAWWRWRRAPRRIIGAGADRARA